MSQPHNRELEELLDLCIEEMLQGRDWEHSVPPAAAVELEPLMLIAKELQHGRDATKLGVDQESRIWARISQAVRLPARLRTWRKGDFGSATPWPELV